MKDLIRISILTVFSGVLICMLISYETLSYNIFFREKSASIILAVSKGGDTNLPLNTFTPRLKKRVFNRTFHRNLEKHFPDWEDRMERLLVIEDNNDEPNCRIQPLSLVLWFHPNLRSNQSKAQKFERLT